MLKEINRMESLQSKYIEPKIMASNQSDNEVKKIDTYFENSCMALEANGVQNAKNLTVYEFYKRIDFYTPKNGRARH